MQLLPTSYRPQTSLRIICSLILILIKHTHFSTAISCTVMALLSLVPMYENMLGLSLERQIIVHMTVLNYKHILFGKCTINLSLINK